jgi:hypothetical protein
MKKSRGFGKSTRSSKAVALAIGLVALTPFLISHIYLYENGTSNKLEKESKADVLHFNDSADKRNFVLHIGPASKYGTMIVLEERTTIMTHDDVGVLILALFYF